MAELKPDTLSTVWERWIAPRERIADVLAGTDRIRAKKEDYLPRHESETNHAYDERVDTTVVLGVLRRARDVATGLVVRHPPQPDPDLPEYVALDDATAALGGLTTATARLAREIVTNAWCAIWVEPDASAAGIPRWQILPASRILATRTDADGRIVGIRLKRTEIVELPDMTEATIQEVWRHDVTPLENGRGRATTTVYRQVRGKWEIHESRTVDLPVPYLPIAIGAMDRQEAPTRPPLSDLADEVIRYTQIRSDRDAHLRIASCPIPVQTLGPTEIVDGDEGQFQIGSGKGVRLAHGGDLKVVELAGKAIEASRQELLDSERRMAALSLALIERHVKGAESAESRKIDEAQAGAALRTIGRATERALTEACRLHAVFAAGPGAANDLPDMPIKVSVTQMSSPLSSDEIRILIDIVAAGFIAPEVLVAALERAEMVPPGTEAIPAEPGDLDAVDG